MSSITKNELDAYVNVTVRYYLTLSDLQHTGDVRDALVKYVALSARMHQDEGVRRSWHSR
jgi:hypothetical protein